jgi:hypothetical protein
MPESSDAALWHRCGLVSYSLKTGLACCHIFRERYRNICVNSPSCSSQYDQLIAHVTHHGTRRHAAAEAKFRFEPYFEQRHTQPVEPLRRRNRRVTLKCCEQLVVILAQCDARYRQALTRKPALFRCTLLNCPPLTLFL